MNRTAKAPQNAINIAHPMVSFQQHNVCYVIYAYTWGKLKWREYPEALIKYKLIDVDQLGAPCDS